MHFIVVQRKNALSSCILNTREVCPVCTAFVVRQQKIGGKTKVKQKCNIKLQFNYKIQHKVPSFPLNRNWQADQK